MNERTTAPLRRRIAPSTPLKLELRDDDGSVFAVGFRLSFDNNAIARAETRTGADIMRGRVWGAMTADIMGVMLWSAALAHHPEYDSEEGLEVVRSYIDPGNVDQVYIALIDAYIETLPADKKQLFQKIKDAMAKGEEVPENPTTGATATVSPSPGSSIGPSPAMTLVSPSTNLAG